VPHISTGDMFRAAVKSQTEFGMRARVFMDAGELIPDEVVIGVVRERLLQDDTMNRGFILDGFPRTVKQAEWLDGLLAKSAASTPAPVVISLKVDYNDVLRRLAGRRSCPACGRIYNVYFQPPRVPDVCDVDGSKLVARQDDSEAVISERLKAYEKQTLPLADYYRRRGRLREVSGDASVEQVTAEILKAIEHDRL